MSNGGSVVVQQIRRTFSQYCTLERWLVFLLFGWRPLQDSFAVLLVLTIGTFQLEDFDLRSCTVQ